MVERESALWRLASQPVTAQWSAARTAVGERSGNYRPDIDGLRGVAISLVIAYHALPATVPGGIIGVDVFFVISGYLITRLVLASSQQGSFSLSGFYQRRVRRIVPALLVVLAAVYAISWYALLPNEFRWLGKSMLWCGPFLANVFFSHVTGYFDVAADDNLLLHLWSLAVEEQFYLVWPLLLMVAVRYGATRRVLGAVIVASLAISVWGAHYYPLVHFFLPGARAWELAVGGMLAARQLEAVGASGAWWSRGHWDALAGLALIAAGAVLLSAANAFPGAWGAIPTLGAALLIGAGPDSWINRRLLGSRPLVFVGRVSYSLYLWHWPMFALTRGIWGRELPAAAIAGVIAAAFAAATLSYYLVETPLRRGALGRAAVPALLAGLIGFTALGAATADNRIAGRLSGTAFNAWEQAIQDWHISGEGSVQSRDGFETITLRSHRETTALFIGDSHIQQYWPRIVYLIDSQPEAARSVLFAAYAGCPGLPGMDNLRQPRNCDGFFAYATEQAFQPRVDTVVFGDFWELYLLGEYRLDSRQGVFSSGDFLRIPLRLDSPATLRALQQFESLLARLVASGRRVFIVLSNPTSPQFDPASMVPPRVRLSPRTPRLLSADRERRIDAAPYESYVAPLMSRLRAIAARDAQRRVEHDARSAAVSHPQHTHARIGK